VTVWRTERRHGNEAAPVAWNEEQVPRRALSPRDRFVSRAPVEPPVSPALPPVVRPPGPPAVPAPQGQRRKAPRGRYDWRVTRHVARPVEVADTDRHFLATFGWATAWFAVPYALFALWSLTFPASPGTACARPTGNTCPSPRSLALTTLIDSLPKVAGAMAIALVVAGLIRLGSTAWRPITSGFAAAIIGSGAATVLYSVLFSTS
jgi:hypothetical protein